MSALRDAPDALEAARAAWRKARSTWKPSDAFLFGPASDLGLTGGAIDTPADAAKIEALVAGDTPIDAAAVARLGANEKGFGGLEVLLFASARDPRRAAFGALLATELLNRITAVRDAWANSYAQELTTAGRGSATFTSEHQGIDIVVNALVSAAEIIVTLHLAQPLGLDKGGPPKPEAVESPYADASLDDLRAELSGIEAIYLGTRNGGTGLSLADAVADRNPSADTDLKTALTKAKAALGAIPGPLRTAVVNWRDAVQTAHQACRDVKRALATEVAGALGTSLGFTVTDGD
jgi:predicted lipoprotein